MHHGAHQYHNTKLDVIVLFAESVASTAHTQTQSHEVFATITKIDTNFFPPLYCWGSAVTTERQYREAKVRRQERLLITVMLNNFDVPK